MNELKSKLRDGLGSEIYKSSIDDFINGVKNDSFFISLNVDAPFASTENFELNIYHNDSYII